MINLNYQDKLMKNRLLKNYRYVFFNIYCISMLITKPGLFSCLFSPEEEKKYLKKKLFSVVNIEEKVNNYDSFSWLVNF